MHLTAHSRWGPLRKVIRYIRRNPVKVHLGEDEYSLWESEVAKAVK
ncbi:MAG: hypothetical protein WCK77_25365 [Verrucomicrobiota bacterium]